MQTRTIIWCLPFLLFILNSAEATKHAKDNNTYALNLLADPADGGIVEGSGFYPANEEVLISATPASAYAFIHWTDQFGDVLTTQTNFTFTMPAYDVELTAHFSCVPDWNPEPYQQYNMQVVGNILIDDEISLNPNDMVGAFVNGECRGVASPMPEFGGLVFLTVVSNQVSGETVELRIWNSDLCESCYTAQSFEFANEGDLGNLFDPLMIYCPTEIMLELNFNQGYTWFSLNINQESFNPNDVFADLEPCYDDRIIGQHNFALYSGEQWIGDLTELSPQKMYRMRLCSAQSILLEGELNAMDTIYLNAGYSWLGYLPQNCLPVNEALAGLSPEPAYNDRIIAQNAFALFNGTQWIGSLNQMCPGKGYIIKLTNPSSLNYAASLRSPDPGSKTTGYDSPTGNYPAPNPQHTMLLVAKLKLDSDTYSMNPKDVVFAYINDEVRGMAMPSPENEGLVFMNIGANNEEAREVSFKVWLETENRLFEMNEQLYFVPLKAVGQLNDPFELSFQAASPFPYTGSPFPNPTRSLTTTPYTIEEASEIQMKLFNQRGILAAESVMQKQEAGTYHLTINREGFASGTNHGVMSIKSDSIGIQKTFKIIGE